MVSKSGGRVVRRNNDKRRSSSMMGGGEGRSGGRERNLSDFMRELGMASYDIHNELFNRYVGGYLGMWVVPYHMALLYISLAINHHHTSPKKTPYHTTHPKKPYHTTPTHPKPYYW